jgi:hypothetical protein
MNSNGGCVSTEEACELFAAAFPDGIQDLHSQFQRGEIIAYKTAKGRYLIPKWQFAPDGRLIHGLPEVLKAIRKRIPGSGQLSPFTFFLQADPVTGGQTPLDTLRNGNLRAVLDAVDSRVS